VTVTETFESHAPSTGDLVGTFPVHGEDEVRAAVVAARTAAQWWGGIGFRERRRRLQAWAADIAARELELATLVSTETGKPIPDAVLEIALSLDHLRWAARNADRVLGRRRVSRTLLTANQSASVSYEPFGVIGVIGPWNYPVFTPMGSISYALAAGNAVVYKPSEFTTATGAWLVESLARVVPEAPVLQQISGGGGTGTALCRAGVDKISFTGSTATGSRVMATCAETLTPVVLELGGKDALLVDTDANVKAAADAAAFGGFSNAGQSCTAVERVYVVAERYDEFVAELKRILEGLSPGGSSDSSYGPMTMPAQVDVVRRHVAAALSDGGHAVVGGPDAVGDRLIRPVLLTDVPSTSAAATEETFGPTIVVTRVRDLDEAITLANATQYGLAATVFGKRRAVEAAARLRVGMVSINSWVMYAGVPALPWGGVGSSGFGRIHGADGLREFARSKAVTRQQFKAPLTLTSFDRAKNAHEIVMRYDRLRHRR
jgi:acyl-CoA reductase-like NAD-dependent aldehyde dehydrogenase